MADLSITAANVVRSATDAQTENGTAGATITAGQTVYKDEADSNKWKLADANASILTAAVYGIALNGASNGQPLVVQTAGDITIGATLTVGAIYVQSGTAGGIAPTADLVTGWYSFIIGIGKTASVMRLVLRGAGVAVP